MLSRIAAGVIVLSWVTSMTWLVRHDLWPAWTAQPPPRLYAADWVGKRTDIRLQAGIFSDSGRIGTIWTVYKFGSAVIVRSDLIRVDGLTPKLPGLRVDMHASYTPEGTLDDFQIELRVVGLDVPIVLKGERFPRDFAFTINAGLGRLQTFKLPLEQAGMITEAFNPFTTLPDLEVGRSWTMQVINPLSLFTGVGDRFTPMVVKVTAKESIATNYGQRDCFVVEAPSVKAWVDMEGIVQIQEVKLPIGRTLRVIREPYDPAMYRQALRSRGAAPQKGRDR